MIGVPVKAQRYKLSMRVTAREILVWRLRIDSAGGDNLKVNRRSWT